MKSTSQNKPLRLFLTFTILTMLLFTVSMTSAINQPIVTTLTHSKDTCSKFAGKAIPKLPKRPGYRLSA